MKKFSPSPRFLTAARGLVLAGALFGSSLHATTFTFGGPVAWNSGTLSVDVLTGAYGYGNGGLTPTRAVFTYFGGNDQIVTYLSGSSLNYTTPPFPSPLRDEYSSNVGLGASVGAGSAWGGPGSLYKNGTSQYQSGLEGFLGFSIFDGGLGGTRYGYFSLTRDNPTNSWLVNGLEISDVAGQSITTRSLAPLPPPPPAVPDSGATALLLGGALGGVVVLRRRLGPA